VTRDQELDQIAAFVRDRGVVRATPDVRSDAASALASREYCRRGGRAKAAKHVPEPAEAKTEPAEPKTEPAEPKRRRAPSSRKLPITGAQARAAIREYGSVVAAARGLGCSPRTVRDRRSEP
jgi:hypothetical protein